MYGGNDASWVWGLVMMVVMVGVVALIVWAIVRTGDRPGAAHRPDALGILEERFARGEIDQEEFERRRQVLQKR
ncbi:MAG: SHOCT domain-containing protein [Actinomycetota bacterium]